MNTEFKIFTSDYGFYVLEEDIKEYQEKHNMEIKNIVLIKSNDDETIIGVIFEKRSIEDEELEELEERILGFREWYTCKYRSARKRN